ncbi:MAG TPA: beta-ketoacyl synthase N-terminal-like domain-containing protein, partial [Pilimelia sp.]|nr:beta-ketoacyl synthase N-terminal-like domain-containing protein [Pilimelia sp.]
MSAAPANRDLVIAISPCGTLEPSPRIVTGATGGGGLGVLDLAGGNHWALRALTLAARWSSEPIGVRVAAGCTATVADVERAGNGRVDLVVLTHDAPWPIAEIAPRYRVLVEVTSRDEAREAAAAGAHGLIARGMEAGGRVGELSSFVLLQQLVADDTLAGVPVWIAGGVGPRTAAACVTGGAAGVVLDSQLALMPESDLPDDVMATVRRMDGSETVLVGQYRGIRRGGPKAIGADRTADDDAANLMPVGQDGWLAAVFAERWPSTAAAVRDVRAGILDAADDEAAAGILAPGSPLARELGVQVPVAQGPMTRVSDQAGFAAAVAGAGALPFIALALANPEQSRRMLTDAAAALADRPWGVGVLGFAPEELREAQIEAIREVKPTCAIIAGGRPAQAKLLEETGISTFLHVPSPTLLRQFLRSGARKFVFEGAECGGHVGPRASFPLWEAQLAVLEEYLDDQPEDVAAQVRVFFAGGIHDARSAAMVAAMASPLARRGAGVGVLMGTAYLFTREAVEHGAIQPLFQRQVLAAERTALLETAPGHATRCVHSQFVDDFHNLRTQLEADGIDSREIWQQLELLNVGRLRIASKGLRRDGDSLITVDEAGQATEGLFMAGQVAVLRDTETTLAALHDEVSAGASDFHAGRVERLREALGLVRRPAEQPAAQPADIAIVGMSCMFPGSPDLAGYWRTVLSGADAITEVPAERWDVETYYAPEVSPGEAGRRSVSKWGGFLDPVPIDPIRFGIPPAALSSIDPAQLLALESAHRALVDSGYAYDAPGADHARTGVVFGCEAGSDLASATGLRQLLPAYLGELPAELDAELPTVTEDSFPGALPNVIAGRIANRLDLGGANYTVDAACAASLAAVDVAVKELATGAADMMLCGGVDLHNGINDYLMFTSVHALSPTGRCRTFDSTADGISLGEGVACVVLKRLADAERDGDRIYAVIKGVGGGSDGRALGLTAPRPDGQRRALQRAYDQSGLSPSDVGLVEAHGTGTVVGDRTELETLTRLFTEAGAEPGSCALGSVKSQIGHTKCAAGLAGMIKATLAIYTGVRPPTINLSRPNSAWDPQHSPFAFFTQARPWAVPTGERVAGVSAFGFGGANFHVVLSGYAGTPEPRHSQDAWPAELFCFRGADRPAAHRAVQKLAASLAAGGTRSSLRELAATAARESDSRVGPVQVAVVARDVDELATLLRRALAGEHDPASGLVQPTPPTSWTGPGKLAFLFPGQGSQRPGALADLFVAFPEVRHYLGDDPRWARLLFPPAALDPEREREQEDRIRDTRVAQPVLGIGGLAVNHLLRRLGVQPDMAAGHSYGELVALCTAGAFDAETLMTLSTERAAAILAAAGDDAGTMAAVSATPDEVRGVLATAGLTGEVVLANHNAPTQIVISGPTPAIEKATAALKQAKLQVRRLQVACAFHSPVVDGAGELFAEVLAGQPVAAPRLPVWSNRTTGPYDPSRVREELAAQIGSPVRFAEQIEAMYADGARIFVEVGPGEVLTRLVRNTLTDRPHLAVACDSRPGQGLRGFLTAVAQLACSGVPVHTGWLFHGRQLADPAAARPQGRPVWTVDGHLVRDHNGACLPGGLKPARRIKELQMTTSDTVIAGGAGPDRDALLSEFLRTSREMVAAQRDVMLAYFGDAGRGRLVWQPAEAYPAAGLPVEAYPMATLPVEYNPVAAVAAPAPAAPAPAAMAPAAVAPVAPAAPAGDALPDFQAAILAVISERTGYPIDLIDLDLDLEADLSIDSIKRAEVAGEVATRLELSVEGDESELEDLVKARTVRTMVNWLTERANGALAATAETAEITAEPITAELVSAGAGLGKAPKRLVPLLAALPQTTPDPASTLAGATFLITGGTPVAAQLAELLTGHGATVRTGRIDDDGPELAAGVDGLVILDALAGADADTPLLPGAFPLLKQSLAAGPRWVLAAADASLPVPADGLRGLFRTVAREYPQARVRFVDVAAAAPAQELASQLLDELLTDGEAPVVSRRDGARYAFELAPVGLGALADNGAGPAGEGASEAKAVGLDQ